MRTDENVNEIVVDIVRNTGVDLEADDISIAHRINIRDDASVANGTPKIPSIICKLKSRSKRGEIFENRKYIKVKKSPTTPPAPHPNAAIFDDVTPLRSRIMYSLRNRKVSGSPDRKVYKYVWSRDGRIYCRTEEEAQRREMHNDKSVMPKPHVINKPQDLAKLGWSPKDIHDIIYNVRA